MQNWLHQSSRDTERVRPTEKARGRDALVEVYKTHYAQRQTGQHCRN